MRAPSRDGSLGRMIELIIIIFWMSSVVTDIVSAASLFAGILFIIQIWPLGGTLQSLIHQHNPKKSKAEILSLKNQLANRITGVIHNLIQVPLALYLLMDSEINKNHLYGKTALSTTCLCITVGYFIIDALVCAYYFKAEGPLFLFHALASLTLYTYGAFNGFLHYYGLTFLMWELSTPFVHARWLMHILKMHETKMYFINGLIMISTFFTARCLYGLYLSVDFWSTSQLELEQLKPEGLSVGVIWLYRVTNVGLNGLNLFWMTKMFQKALTFFQRKKA